MKFIDMRFLKYLPLFVVALVILSFLLFSPFDGDRMRGQVGDGGAQSAVVTEVSQVGPGVQVLSVEMAEGQIVEIENDESYEVQPREFEVGDEILVGPFDNGEASGFYVIDYVRYPALIWLFGLFVVMVLVVTRWQGVGSIVGMALSFVVLFKMVLPLILQGFDPVWAAILGALLIIPTSFYFSHGFSRKTTTAAVGTILTLVVTGFLAKFFADFAHISGFASEESRFLQLDTQSAIDFKGLVLAGMIIAILGILDDITISQASVVQQLKSVKNKMKFGELYGRAMKVGRDHIASLVNTLILVYTGASLPLLLLFTDHSQPFLEIINIEFLSEEIIQTLVGSIGLVLAVPITTLLAAFFVGKNVVKDSSSHCNHS